MGKIIPLIKSKIKTSKSSDKNILEEGKIGDLTIRVYQRGVIHILDSNGLVFKKDPEEFEKQLMSLGDSFKEAVILGSGDNDNLILEQEDGDLKITLRKKEHGLITALKKFVEKGKVIKKESK